jgi:hypothetical protein
MTMLLEQHSSNQARPADGGNRTSRRLLWAYTDVWTGLEVSVVRQLASWLLLGITLAIAVLLLIGV